MTLRFDLPVAIAPSPGQIHFGSDAPCFGGCCHWTAVGSLIRALPSGSIQSLYGGPAR